MGVWSSRRTWSRIIAPLLLLAGVACSSEGAPAESAPRVAGIVEVDPDAVQLGENNGGRPSQGGSPTRGGAGGGGTAGSPTKAQSPLGKACEGSSDCATGLSCHLDADYISHLQCTTDCDSDDPCEAIDENSFCIGAHVCVHACTTDADCPSKTRCNKSGWCERTGPGSGVPYCGGFATPCGLLTDSTCTSGLGCRDDSECSGSATGCYSQFDSFSCSSQDGCYWSSLSKSCSGSAHSCFSYSIRSSCEFQEGCYWTARCTGTPRDCNDVPVSLCSSQPGCVTQTD
jgi:hypothetical protein